jgi:hypothetical protein
VCFLCICTNEEIGNDGMFCVPASVQKIASVCVRERETKRKTEREDACS